MNAVGSTIAVLGGTGKEGSGFAFRWAHAGHRVVPGSRGASKAVAAAAELNTLLAGRATIEGVDNLAAAGDAAVVVLAVPFAAQRATAIEVRDALQGKILIDVTVPLAPPRVDKVQLPEGGSAVEHRLGYVMANADIDMSNVEGGGETVLLLPLDPDASCARLRAALRDRADVGIVINDSFGRAWRNGVAGVALGVARVPGVVERGRPDRFGRALQVTQIGFADEIESAASLLMGQADEGYPVIHARGVPYARRDGNGRELLRPKNMDLFR